jgi:hypothetical protein
VRSVKTILALLLALAWAPMMSHCVLETFPGLDFLRCAADAQTADNTAGHCDQSACCAAESGPFDLPNQPPLLPTFTGLPLPFAALTDCLPSLPARPRLPALPPAPPELPVSWQFSCRAALPVRAPSLAS